jgi:hypothetical protein
MGARLVGEIPKRLSLPNADLLPDGSRRSVWTGKTKRKEKVGDRWVAAHSCTSFITESDGFLHYAEKKCHTEDEEGALKH